MNTKSILFAVSVCFFYTALVDCMRRREKKIALRKGQRQRENERALTIFNRQQVMAVAFASSSHSLGPRLPLPLVTVNKVAAAPDCSSSLAAASSHSEADDKEIGDFVMVPSEEKIGDDFVIVDANPGK